MRSVTRKWLSKLNVTAAGVLTCGGGFYLYNSLYQRSTSPGGPLHPSEFTPFTLVTREKVSDTSCILRLQPKHHVQATSKIIKELETKGVWSVEIKQPQLQIARRYTPLPTFHTTTTTTTPTVPHTHFVDSAPTTAVVPADTDADGDAAAITLLVKREPRGEVSRYLHNIPIGSTVEVRGGYSEYTLPAEVKHVVFLAGGTGIAPALQVAHALRQRGNGARMTVFWANRGRGDCVGGADGDVGATGAVKDRGSWMASLGWSGAPEREESSTTDIRALEGEEKGLIVKQLDYLSSESVKSDHSLDLRARYFIDEEGTFVRQLDLSKALAVFNTKAGSDSGERGLILISGPDGFVEYLAGPKRLVNGLETQGPLGGLLARVDVRGCHVWKL